MRALRAFSLGVVMSLVLGANVASAAPGQVERFGGTGQITDDCTGEVFNNTFSTQIVNTDSGPFHLNVHLQGIGVTSGARYEGHVIDNEFGHVLPDGTFMTNQVMSVRTVSQGDLPNSWFTFRMRQIWDSDNNLISQTIDTSSGCA